MKKSTIFLIVGAVAAFFGYRYFTKSKSTPTTTTTGTGSGSNTTSSTVTTDVPTVITDPNNLEPVSTTVTQTQPTAQPSNLIVGVSKNGKFVNGYPSYPADPGYFWRMTEDGTKAEMVYNGVY